MDAEDDESDSSSDPMGNLDEIYRRQRLDEAGCAAHLKHVQKIGKLEDVTVTALLKELPIREFSGSTPDPGSWASGLPDTMRSVALRAHKANDARAVTASCAATTALQAFDIAMAAVAPKPVEEGHHASQEKSQAISSLRRRLATNIHLARDAVFRGRKEFLDIVHKGGKCKVKETSAPPLVDAATRGKWKDLREEEKEQLEHFGAPKAAKRKEKKRRSQQRPRGGGQARAPGGPDPAASRSRESKQPAAPRDSRPQQRGRIN